MSKIPDRPIPYALTERAACAGEHGASGQHLGRSPGVLPSSKQGQPEGRKPGERPRELFVQGLLTAIAAETDCPTCVRLLLELEGAMVAMRRLTLQLREDLEHIPVSKHANRMRVFADDAEKPSARVKAARKAYQEHVRDEGCL